MSDTRLISWRWYGTAAYNKHIAEHKMATTKTNIALSPLFSAFYSTPIEKLREQREPDTKPKKPKPVTDEQLLAIVDELVKKIDRARSETKKVRDELEAYKAYVKRNYKLKFFAQRKTPLEYWS